MAAGRYSFVIEQGSTTNFEIAYKDSNLEPIDLTNHQARMQIRPNANSDIIYLTLSSSREDDGTGLNISGSNGINPPTSGTIGIYISAYSSSQLDFAEAYYDLEIITGSTYPVVTRILEGKVQLSKEVTKGNY